MSVVVEGNADSDGSRPIISVVIPGIPGRMMTSSVSSRARTPAETSDVVRSTLAVGAKSTEQLCFMA